jgi:hypothetical protein
MTAVLAGDPIKASHIMDILAPGWDDWTSSFNLFSTGTQPSLGNSATEARYRRSDAGDLYDYAFAVVIGSTFTGGTGIWEVPMPFPLHADEVDLKVGDMWILDAGTIRRLGGLHVVSTTRLRLVSDSGDISATNPWTWVTPDAFAGTVSLRPAS